jgi:NADH:ubiquinone oxidoreductase subunit F (NADH-binding)
MTAAATTLPPAQVARLLSGLGPTDRPVSYAEHLRQHGPLPPRGSEAADLGLIQLVERSGLLGRGGAGFPTGRKMRAVAAGGARPVLVANGVEGEPVGRKDALLLSRLPHLVLDGMVLAARAVGAVDGYLCIYSGIPGLPALQRALAERDQAADGVRIGIDEVPHRYVSSEKSSLVNWLEGGAAVPLFSPPATHEQGVDGRPTLIQNVETLAHLALIARRGADWFRSIGQRGEPGSLLVTVAGAVPWPGVVEVASGTPIGEVLAMAGAQPAGLSAVLVGGYFGGWLPVDVALPVPLSHAGLRSVGLGLGAGILVALPAGACGLVETARVAWYLAGESAGQCGPCRNGLPAIAGALTAVARGERGSAAAIAAIERWSSLVDGRGACRLPDGAVRFVGSAWRAFSTDVARHTRWGPCPGVHHPPVLPVPDDAGRPR